ncbi:hypothetical protein ROHU_026532 [Labeo rohita]|uniref:Uncharacterized protein n=1 Tax=Labeo rohita TaxID=84645 RepID=A0A498MA48_LABRO|nr:hypothetical protein ROHU_026532 [Labeo rohita]
MEFTQSLQHLPEIHLDDVHRLADKFSLTTRSKLDKGYKFFIEQYLFAYEGPLPDPHIIASAEKLQDKRPQPGICKLLHGLEALNFVDSKFGTLCHLGLCSLTSALLR